MPTPNTKKPDIAMVMSAAPRLLGRLNGYIHARKPENQPVIVRDGRLITLSHWLLAVAILFQTFSGCPMKSNRAPEQSAKTAGNAKFTKEQS